ncbi:MAG TPA: ChbG/HpnK family deacetylase [Thermoanaerobaculia bacterium]|nr:ChbG/HpnK family deacetylase [Thermoanaerobaculia bacterium]
MATARLIVTADDAGLHRGMTEGAIRAHREGIVTACSVVANGVAFDDAVARLRDVPSLEVGVHLTLVEEKPLTAMRFPRKYTTFVPLYLARAISMRDIEREFRAQIEKVLATGLRVTHLNSHQHLHMLPRIFSLASRLANEYEIGYVRVVNDRGGSAGLLRRLSVAALSTLGRSGRTIGVLEAGHIRDVVPLLDHVEETTELVTHPGVGVDGYPQWNYDWEAETRALCAPGLRDELVKRGIELIAPSASR